MWLKNGKAVWGRHIGDSARGEDPTYLAEVGRRVDNVFDHLAAYHDGESVGGERQVLCPPEDEIRA